MARFFSIGIPVHEVAPYLRECLDSVLSQTCVDWECVCVDDGSRDGSGGLLDDYVRRDVRFRAIHQCNGGVSSARNRALDAVCGRWVWFVDGDDAIHPGALTRFTDVLGRFPSAQAIAFRSATRRWEPLRSEQLRLSVRRSCDSLRRFALSASFVLYRREAIGKLRFPAYCVGEDGLFSLRYCYAIEQWVETELPLYYYREREGSVMRSPPTECFLLDWNEMLYERVCLLGAEDDITTGGGKGLFDTGNLAAGVAVARLRPLSAFECRTASASSRLAPLDWRAECGRAVAASPAPCLLFAGGDPFPAVDQSFCGLSRLRPHLVGWQTAGVTRRPSAVTRSHRRSFGFRASSCREVA